MSNPGSDEFRHLRFLALCMVVIAVIGIGFTGAQGEEPRSSEVRSAFGRMMTEDRAVNSAYNVCEQVARLSADEKLRRLAEFVLPSPDHDSLRLQCDWTPTNPSPLVPSIVKAETAESAAEGRCLNAGSDLASPARELIRVAHQLGQLPAIRSRIQDWQPPRADDRKAATAMLMAIGCAQGDFVEAEQHLQTTLRMAKDNTLSRVDRTPETFALWAAADHPELRPLVEELAHILFDDVRIDQPRRAERWKRLIFAKRMSILHPAKDTDEEASPSEWIPVSHMISETRGAGYPRTSWQTQRKQTFHRTGHDHDYVYYRSPLTGQFRVEADTTTFEFRDIHLGYGGLWFGSAWDLKGVVNGTFHWDRRTLPLDPPLTRILKLMRTSLDVRDKEIEFFVNGRSMLKRPHQAGDDPWLSIHSWWLTNGTVSNLRITGQPTIPNVISMMTPELNGWLAYYDEAVGIPNAQWQCRSVEPSLELISVRRPELEGTYCESLLRYHRPVVEDGTIEYEFYYEPGKTEVHPVLDRLCLLLTPEGVDIHWATDNRHDPSEVSPDHRIQEPHYRLTSGPLPLLAAEWNHVTLTIEGDTLRLKLNGTEIYSRPIESTNLRTFGLFHWADQTEVRVRNLRWTGSWPKQLPSLGEQQLADLSLEERLGDRRQLQPVLSHQFRNGLPPHLMSIVGDDWQSHVVQRKEGLHITRPAGEYVNYTLISPITIQGDFDIIADYDEFRSQGVTNGEGGIQLAALLDDELASNCFLFRKQMNFPNNLVEQIAQAAIFRKRGNETEYLFFEAPPEESVAGRLRLVRRGTTLYSLLAERDSDTYRLIHEETVTRDDASFRFIVGHHKGGQTSVLLKSLDVRASGYLGLVSGPLKTIPQLDQERQQLAEQRVWDFQKPPPRNGPGILDSFSIFGAASGTMTADDKGLLVDAPGTDNWTATGLMPRCQIEGDFDISLDLEVLHMEPCQKYGETCVLLLTEFRNEIKATIETKFSIHDGGDRKAETQIRNERREGSQEYRELVSQKAVDARLLRLARRGDVVYQVFQSSTDKTPLVLGAVKLGRDPVVSGDLRVLVHTGGDNRKTIVRFRTLSVQADKVTD